LCLLTRFKVAITEYKDGGSNVMNHPSSILL
jgi:hypothetical protein